LLPAVSKEVYHFRGIEYLEYSLTQLSDIIVVSKHNGDVSPEKRICISCVPRCLFHAYLLCPESSTARVRVAAKNLGVQNVQQFERSYPVLLYVTIVCTHTELLNDIDSASYIMLLSNVTIKKSFRGKMAGTLCS
jgi:hypothetical protein